MLTAIQFEQLYIEHQKLSSQKLANGIVKANSQFILHFAVAL